VLHWDSERLVDLLDDAYCDDEGWIERVLGSLLAITGSRSGGFLRHTCGYTRVCSGSVASPSSRRAVSI